MKSTVRIISLVLVLVFALTAVSSFVCLAAEFDVGQAIGNVEDEAKNEAQGEEKFKVFGATFLYAVQMIGTALAVILLVIFGIKWMVAGPQARAQLKEQAWNYVFGAVFLFGCVFIAQWVYDIVTSIN